VVSGGAVAARERRRRGTSVIVIRFSVARGKE
jgi:hypothetical protein